MEPVESVPEETLALTRAAREHGIRAQALGGAGVYLTCPSARSGPLSRRLKDIDLAARGSQRAALDQLLRQRGYLADTEFNTYHGRTRLLFHDRVNHRQLDVFLDRMTMCHALDLGPSLANDAETLTATDLLLTKLQVVELNERDLSDAAALLLDCELDTARIAKLLAADWGWWRTATETLRRVGAYAAARLEPEARAVLADRLEALVSVIEATPRTLKWKARARIGERVPWYQQPEETLPSPGA